MQRLALALWLAGCGGPANLVLVSVDTLRPDHLPSYGYARETSAAIERLAREGVLWENAYATSPATVASHASLFTGRFPHQHLALHYGTPLAEPELTLAEILQGSGYVGAGFSGNFRLLEALGYAQGFEQWFAGTTVKEDPRGEELRRRSLAWLDQARQAAPKDRRAVDRPEQRDGARRSQARERQHQARRAAAARMRIARRRSDA